MEKKIKKEYKNEDISVVWQPDICTHSKNCWRELKSVFQPIKRPWIDPTGATTSEIIAQIEKCPSGALSYYYLKNENILNQDNMKEENINVKVIPGGPLMVTGTCEITHSDGSVEVKENKTTFCRCGASSNKPFCDGTHKGIDWK